MDGEMDGGAKDGKVGDLVSLGFRSLGEEDSARGEDGVIWTCSVGMDEDGPGEEEEDGSALK